jgi:hypothetical protein
MNLFISGIHVNIAFNLRNGDTLSVPVRDYIVKAKDKIKCFLVNCSFINALGLALTNYHLLHLANNFDVFDDV